MCGIFGAIQVNVSGKVGDVVASLQQRGPDGHGVYEDKDHDTTLVHTRLSIIDTTNSAAQPMEYGDWVITFNGEIYNYQELRKELGALGYQFKTHSDTEVVLLAYHAWREKCLTRFRGMFAFGVWNKNDQTFFAARDYFGIKPFYYHRNGKGLIFSSLLTSLLASGIPAKQVNLTGMAIFLQLGSFSGEQTIIEQIQQLPAAHYLTLENGNLTITRYWNIVDEAAQTEQPASYKEAVKQVRSLLEASAQYQLVADVPVGAFLSAGVDSCVAVGLMSKFSPTKLNTFTVGFEKKFNELNELNGARLISKRFGTDHHELIVNDKLITEQIDDYILAMDQPSMDGLNTYLISKETARLSKVAVTGLGSDEIFGGYAHFAYAAIANLTFSKGMESITELPSIARRLPAKYRELLEYVISTPVVRHRMVRNYGKRHPVAHKLKNIDEDVHNTIIDTYYDGYAPAELDAVQQLSLWEIHKYLSNTLLRDGDALSMSQALEVRPMFLDHQLASYVFGLKASYKVNFTRKKRVLVDACSDLLPPEIFTKKKTGFELPLTHWLKNNLQSEFLNLLKGEAASNLFTETYRLYLEQSLQKGEVNNAHWAVFVALKFIQIHKLETHSS
jgi:asparagine synthase (glutamine-hydrolysing)